MTFEATADFSVGANEARPSARNRLAPIVRTAAALLSIQGVTWLTSLIAVAIVPRYLGASQYGLMTAAGTLVVMGTILAGFGTGNHVVKTVARDPAHGRNAVVHALAVRLTVWGCLVAIAAIALVVVDASTTTRLVFAFLLAGGTFTVLFDGFVAGLQGNQTMGRAALATAAISLIGQGGLVLALVLGGGAVHATFVMMLANAGGAIAAGLFFLSLLRGGIMPSRLGYRAMALGGLPFLGWELGQKFYSAVDFVLLGALTNSATVGEYAFAYRLVSIPVFACTIITAAIYPSLAASAHADPAWFRNVLTNGARIVFIGTLPAACGVAVLSPQLVDLLSGGQFEGAAVLLAIVAWVVPAAAVHTILGTGLFASDRQTRMAWVAWLAAGFNIVLNLVTIPLAVMLWSNGAIASATATLLTEVFVGAFIWVGIWNSIDRRPMFSTFARAGAACLLMGVVTWVAAATAGFMVAIAAGALAYTAGCLLLRVVSAEELRQVRAMLGRPGRGAPLPEAPSPAGE